MRRPNVQGDNAVRLLNGIHALLYPAPIDTADGRTMVFRPKSPDPHQVLQELSDRIRALPDERITAGLMRCSREGNREAVLTVDMSGLPASMEGLGAGKRSNDMKKYKDPDDMTRGVSGNARQRRRVVRQLRAKGLTVIYFGGAGQLLAEMPQGEIRRAVVVRRLTPND